MRLAHKIAYRDADSCEGVSSQWAWRLGVDAGRGDVGQFGPKWKFKGRDDLQPAAAWVTAKSASIFGSGLGPEFVGLSLRKADAPERFLDLEGLKPVLSFTRTGAGPMYFELRFDSETLQEYGLSPHQRH